MASLRPPLLITNVHFPSCIKDRAWLNITWQGCPIYQIWKRQAPPQLSHVATAKNSCSDSGYWIHSRHISTQLTARGCRCTILSLPTYYPPKYTFWYLLKTECTYKNPEKNFQKEKTSKHFTTNLESWYDLFRRIYYTSTFETRRLNLNFNNLWLFSRGILTSNLITIHAL